MTYAILISIITYIYMQWPSIVFSIIIGTILYTVFVGIRSVIASDNHYEWESYAATMRKTWTINAFLIAFCVLIPSQKTLGTSVALGATTFMAHEAITSEIGQKFIKLVSSQANSVLDEKLKELEVNDIKK